MAHSFTWRQHFIKGYKHIHRFHKYCFLCNKRTHYTLARSRGSEILRSFRGQHFSCRFKQLIKAVPKLGKCNIQLSYHSHTQLRTEKQYLACFYVTHTLKTTSYTDRPHKSAQKSVLTKAERNITEELRNKCACSMQREKME